MVTLLVTTHDGVEYTVNADNYDPTALNDALNNNDLNTVAIGDLVISRINVKTIIPQTESGASE